MYFRFPAPRVPPLSLLQDLIGDAISIAIVALAINMSLAKMYGARFGYDIDPNQVKNCVNRSNKKLY